MLGRLSPAEVCSPERGRGCRPYIQLAHLVVGVALREVLHVGQLQVHLRKPHENALPGPLEFFPLVGEMLRKRTGCLGGWQKTVQVDSKVTFGQDERVPQETHRASGGQCGVGSPGSAPGCGITNKCPNFSEPWRLCGQVRVWDRGLRRFGSFQQFCNSPSQ